MKNLYKQALVMLVLLTGPASLTLSQDFLPAMGDNYMGINQAALQPAAIVDSRFKVDINFFGFNSDIFNDAIRFNTQWMFDLPNITTDDNWWTENSSLNNANGQDKNFFFSQSVLGPGFLISLGPKHAVGFTSRVRSITNADDLSESLFRSMYNNYEESQYWNHWYLDKEMRAMQHNFADYGLSYATEILNTGANYLKGGVTLKLLQGINAAYIQSDSLFYYFDGTEGAASYPVSWNSPYVYAGMSGNWGTFDENDLYEFSLNYQFTAKPSVGFDVGFVYEFRPKYMNYLYDMDGEKGLERKDQNKYLLKIGASVLDIGRLKYDKEYNSFDFYAAFTPDYLERYKAGDDSYPANTFWLDVDDPSFSFDEFVNFVDTVFQRAESGRGTAKSGSDMNKFTVRLPAALSLQVDVNIVKGLYVNLTTFTGLYQGYSQAPSSHYMSNYSITPRYEHKWFTLSVPVQYNQMQKMNIGLGIRAAFVYFGVNNLFSGLYDDPYSINAYLGIKIPIFQDKPPSDLDNDGVSDEKDKCIDTPGPWEFFGCPDRDGDGVADTEDACPDIPGLKEFKGCPDRDGDGVPDSEDDCPDIPGPKLTNGCPDRDNDGVIDDRDECPDVPGPAQLNGCPDRDGDGVPDIKDQCPDLAGPVDQGGCPFLDTDGDGVKDADDRCPDQKGPPENNGCPYSDTDADGVIDKEDRCPLTPGDPANFGCPVLKVEEAAVLKTAFENLEFETGKAVIRSSSFTSMNELATLLISKPAWKLRISGHTDDVGSDASNMTLSKNRAQATGKYLEGKGVAPGQIIAEWFGETKPIADNGTPDGRQKNRRVEMQVVFD